MNPTSADKEFVEKLSKHLFWDVRQENISLAEDRLFLVARILEYGLMDDWNLLKTVLTIEEIAETAQKLRYLDDVSLHFISAVSDTPLESYRCYNNRQYLKGHWSS